MLSWLEGHDYIYAVLKYKPLSDFQLPSAFYIVNQKPFPFALFQRMLFYFMLPQKRSVRQDEGAGSMCVGNKED